VPDIYVNDEGQLRKLKRVFVNNLTNLTELKQVWVNDEGALPRLVFKLLSITMTTGAWYGIRTSPAPPSNMTLSVQSDGVLHLGDDTPSDEDWNSHAPDSDPAELTGWTVTATATQGAGWTGDALDVAHDLTLGTVSFTFNNNVSNFWDEGVLEVTIDDGAGTSVTKQVTFDIRNGTPP